MINKEKQALHDTLDQMDVINNYRAFHPKTAEYTFFSSAHKTYLWQIHFNVWQN